MIENGLSIGNRDNCPKLRYSSVVPQVLFQEQRVRRREEAVSGEHLNGCALVSGKLDRFEHPIGPDVIQSNLEQLLFGNAPVSDMVRLDRDDTVGQVVDQRGGNALGWGPIG